MSYDGLNGLLEQGKHLRLAEDCHLVVVLNELLQGVLVTVIQIKILSGIKLLCPVKKLQGVTLCVAREESGKKPAKCCILSVLLFDRFSVEAVEGLTELKHSLNCLVNCLVNRLRGVQIY